MKIDPAKNEYVSAVLGTQNQVLTTATVRNWIDQFFAAQGMIYPPGAEAAARLIDVVVWAVATGRAQNPVTSCQALHRLIELKYERGL